MNFKQLFLVLFISLFFNTVFAQKDGYWDNQRSFKKEIVVSAGGRMVIKAEELPQGTTEVVFRITLLDENQQLANSLFSVLKSIPDPTGISQGSAGAVLLLSKISGEDKCTYAVFSDEDAAEKYKNGGVPQKACLQQDEAVGKDAKRISVEKSSCFSPNANSNIMWFGFESKNWIMNQKIVLEIVPWVNTKLSSGWTVENREFIINQCKTSDLAKKMNNSDDFCVCVLQNMQNEYKFQEFQKLLAAEKSKAYKDFGKRCYAEIGSSVESNLDIRNQIITLEKQAKYGDVILKTDQIIANGKPNAMDYNRLGNAYIRTKQYAKAIKSLKEGEKLDDSELLIQLNLAHAYLLNDDFKTAKPIYKKYQSQNVTDSLSWTQKVQQDFEIFKKTGLPSGDFDKVLRLLED